ncbi:hypothetical protein [Coleofasciculus sp. F4-SAH-05]
MFPFTRTNSLNGLYSPLQVDELLGSTLYVDGGMNLYPGFATG